MTTVPRRTATRRSVYRPTRCSVSRQAERLGGTVTGAVDTPPFIKTPLTSTEADKPCRAKGGKAYRFGGHSHLQMVRAGLKVSCFVGGNFRDPLAVPDSFGVSDQHHLTPGVEDQELHKVYVFDRIRSFLE